MASEALQQMAVQIMLDEIYGARPIKRHRATKAEVEARRADLLEIVSSGRPMTVRQVFYQAVTRNLVEKTEKGYAKVQNDLALMRRDGRLPYAWITDHTRRRRQPITYRGPEDALEDTVRIYRKDLWTDADAYVEVWLEKEALSGVLYPVTSRFDVPLMVARGYPSLSFLHDAAVEMQALNVPAYVYHFGDYDPSGVNAAHKIEQTLRELAPHAEIIFERVAVTEHMIHTLNLPTRPTKTSDSRSKSFGSVSVELDAIDPNTLRALVEDCIEEHLPKHRLETIKAIEDNEREQLRDFLEQLRST